MPPSPVRSPAGTPLHRLVRGRAACPHARRRHRRARARPARRPERSARSTSPRSPRTARSATPPWRPPRARPAGYVQLLDERPSGIARVIATGEPLVVPDAPRRPERPPDLRRALRRRLDRSSCRSRWGGEVRYVAILISARAARLRRRRDRARRDGRRPGRRRRSRGSRPSARRAAGAEQDARRSRAPRARSTPRSSSHEVLETLGREAASALGGDAGRRLPRRRPRRRRRHRRPRRRPRAGTGIVLSRGEGVAGHVLATGRAVRHQRLPDATSEIAHDSLGATQDRRSPSRWCGTTSSRARCRSA